MLYLILKITGDRHITPKTISRMAELWERISPLFRGGFPNNNPNTLCGIHCHSYFHNAEKREEITMKETTCARRFLKTLILLHGNRSIVSESPLLELLPLYPAE